MKYAICMIPMVSEHERCRKLYAAYKYGYRFRLFGPSRYGYISDTSSYESAEECKKLLEQFTKDRTIEVIEIVDLATK